MDFIFLKYVAKCPSIVMNRDVLLMSSSCSFSEHSHHRTASGVDVSHAETAFNSTLNATQGKDSWTRSTYCNLAKRNSGQVSNYRRRRLYLHSYRCYMLLLNKSDGRREATAWLLGSKGVRLPKYWDLTWEMCKEKERNKETNCFKKTQDFSTQHSPLGSCTWQLLRFYAQGQEIQAHNHKFYRRRDIFCIQWKSTQGCLGRKVRQEGWTEILIRQYFWLEPAEEHIQFFGSKSKNVKPFKVLFMVKQHQLAVISYFVFTRTFLPLPASTNMHTLYPYIM